MRGAVAAGLVAAAVAGAVLLLAAVRVGDYAVELRAWQASARFSPEGTAAATLFARAVGAGAIAWDPKVASIDLRRDFGSATDLSLDLFGKGEEGAVLAAEIASARALASYAAVRVRRPACERPCEEDDDWVVTAGPMSTAPAERLALGAARVSGPAGVPAPLPGLHYVLWRAAGDGYGHWSAFTAAAPFRLSLDDPTVDRIDVIGRLYMPPRGWRVVEGWCRDGRLRLNTCPLGAAPDALRLQRVSPVSPAVLDIVPQPVVPGEPPEGFHRLTERLSLDCVAGAVCRPVWTANFATRRYSTFGFVGGDGKPGALPEIIPLRGWVEAVEARGGSQMIYRPTVTAAEIGATAMLGGIGRPPGHLLAALSPLASDGTVAISLDADLQRRAHDLMSDLLSQDEDGPFGDLSYTFPPGGPQMSAVVIDLRNAKDPGAIRAAVGVPEPPSGLSAWDLTAASVDPSSDLPPGPAAWTGRGNQHVPGSAWKLVTALALLDRATDTDIPPAHRDELARLIDGVTAAEADVLLGTGVLTSVHGLCIPVRSDLPLAGAGPAGCGDGYTPPIRDAGLGSPLSRVPTARFGLREALALSSNVWFAAMLLRAEEAATASRDPALLGVGETTGGAPEPGRPGIGLRSTLHRLGFDRPQDLDAGRGLALLPRDPVEVEALGEGGELRALANAAFGQQVQAGPLVLAQVAGSIRTGRDIRPSLLTPIPPPGPLLPATGPADALLGEIRDGMRAVVSGRGVFVDGRVGTAAEPFRARAGDLRRARTGGKTGTAQQRDDSDLRISTFAGWIDTPDGTPGFAIGCSATVMAVPHAGRERLTVPQVCTHYVAALMAAIDAAGLVSR